MRKTIFLFFLIFLSLKSFAQNQKSDSAKTKDIESVIIISTNNLANKEENKVISSSRQLQINSSNGGALTAYDAHVVYDSYQDGNQTYFANGKMFSGSLISSTSLISALDGSAMSADGEGWGSGNDTNPVDKANGPADLAPANSGSTTCFNVKSNRKLITNKTGGSPDIRDIAGPLCSQKVHRISWREVF